MQRAPTSCSPPHGVAADCATLKGRRSRAQFSAPFCWFRAARSGSGPPRPKASVRATQRVARARPLCYEVRPRRAPLAPLMRRCARGRRPKGRISTAQGSTTCTAPIQAPLSAQRGGKTVAGFPARRTARPKARPSSLPRICLTAAPLALRHVSARLGKSCQNAPAHFDDFPP